MTKTDRAGTEEGLLAPWFDAARDAEPLPDGDWMARMEALALAEQPSARPVPETRAAARRGGWRDILGGLGGWPAMAGLAAACAAGVWIGVAAPEGSMSTLLPVSAGDGVSGLEPASGFDYVMAGL